MADQQVFDFRKQKASATGQPRTLNQTVFFVGFMGAGKTSVARKLARNAGVAAVDMDAFIARRCQCTVPEIFAESGEEGFRAIESDVLEELAGGDPCLVSCGGGVVLAQRNREVLNKRGFVVYLKVTAAEAASRISDVSTRPLFGDLDQAEQVIRKRLPLYEEVADITIDTAGRTTGSIAREVFALLSEKGILVQ